MKRVLIVSYVYPPIGGGGVQRIVKFVRYLHEFGWSPAVLTVKGSSGADVMDESLLREVEGRGEIIRVPFLSQEDIGRFWQNAGKWLSLILKMAGKDSEWFRDGMTWRTLGWMYPDGYSSPWIPKAIMAGLTQVRRLRPGVIFASGPPWTSLMVGWGISVLTGVPLVSDFRDLWTVNFGRRPAGRFRHGLDEWWENRIISRSRTVICTTTSSARWLAERYPREPAGKFQTIYNGYDPSDIPQSVGGSPEAFRIGYIGALYGKQSPLLFLSAVERAMESRPELQTQLRIRFVGPTGEYAEALNAFVAKGIAELTGPVSHEQAARFLVGSDLLLLLLNKDGLRVIPGKLFEYLASPAHILAAVPPAGETADVLRRAGGATVVDFDDVAGMSQELVMLFDRWKIGRLSGQRDRDYVSQFDRQTLAGMLAECLDQAADRRN